MPQTIPTTSETRHTPATRKPPGPRSLSPLSSALALQRDPIRFALDMWHQYGDVVRFRFLFWPAYVFYHPDHVKRVLQENYRNYTKNFPNMQVARRVIGNGLFANEGDSWLHQRRLMQPSFHHNKLVGFGRLMTDSTTAMLERWQRTASDDVPLDIPLEMMRLTLRVAGLALFSLDLSHDPSPSLKGVLARDPIGPYEVRGGARRHVGTGLVPVWAPIHAIHPVKHHTSSG